MHKADTVYVGHVGTRREVAYRHGPSSSRLAVGMSSVRKRIGWHLKWSFLRKVVLFMGNIEMNGGVSFRHGLYA